MINTMNSKSTFNFGRRKNTVPLNSYQENDSNSWFSKTVLDKIGSNQADVANRKQSVQLKNQVCSALFTSVIDNVKSGSKLE